jgi:hypothetical protein
MMTAREPLLNLTQFLASLRLGVSWNLRGVTAWSQSERKRETPDSRYSHGISFKFPALQFRGSPADCSLFSYKSFSQTQVAATFMRAYDDVRPSRAVT